MWHFFPPLLQKIIKMSVPREELFFGSTKRATFQKYGNSSTNSFRGILSFSLSLSLVFVVAFHQTHLIPVKDRQTDRKTERQRDRQTDVCLCLSLCLVRLVSQDENLMTPFSWERIETPLQLLSNNWRRRPEKQTDRQTDRQTYVLSLSLSVCLVRLTSQEENLMSPFSKRELRPPPNYYPIIIGGEEDRGISTLVNDDERKGKQRRRRREKKIRLRSCRSPWSLATLAKKARSPTQ